MIDRMVQDCLLDRINTWIRRHPRMACSKYQLGPFEVGQVKAHMEHGLGCTEIASRVFKADGKTLFGETAIVNCMNKLRDNKQWMGRETRRLWGASQNVGEAR